MNIALAQVDKKTTIKEEVWKFIFENFILDPEEVVEDRDSLIEKGIVDSTGILELVAFIEENYQITVNDEELIPENLDSIQNITQYIHRKLILQ